MNHLAHAYLSGDNERLLIGNLMGDFVKGAIDPALDEDIRRGIRLHRLIDSATDADPAFRRSRERIAPPWRRYAGILVDIFYDHFLSKYWERYSTQPLPDYARSVYTLLHRERTHLPQDMQRFLSYMIANDVFTAYGTMEGIDRVLHGMSRRLSFANPLAGGTVELERNYEGLHGDFDEVIRRLAMAVESAAV